MRRVIIESPYAGNLVRNIEYARRSVRDSLLRNEAPLASHLLYTQPGILDDEVPAERAHGIMAGHEWMALAHAVAFYVDYGMTAGMDVGLALANQLGKEIEKRIIGENT